MDSALFVKIQHRYAE